MSYTRFTVVEGTTLPLTFQITENNLNLDLTLFTVTLLLTDATGANIDTTGLVLVPSPLTGTVTYNPNVGDLLAANSPYAARFVLTDSGGLKKYAPYADRELWDVVPQ